MPLADKFRAFKWHVIELADGNDMAQIEAAFAEAREVTGAPVAIIAETVKGKGVSFMENQVGWHGKRPMTNSLSRPWPGSRQQERSSNGRGQKKSPRA